MWKLLHIHCSHGYQYKHWKVTKGLIVNENTVKTICLSGIEILAEEPQVLRITPPVTVCGDIHWQFYDLKELFNWEVKFLIQSTYFWEISWVCLQCQNLSSILSTEYKTPWETVVSSREPWKQRYNLKVWFLWGMQEEICRVIGCMAALHVNLSAVIDGKVFCVHDGLSPSILQLMKSIKLRKTLYHQVALHLI